MDYSVIIPAFNEEDYLPQTLAALKQAMAGQAYQGEVILVDNNSTDQTPQIAKDHGITLVFEPINQISRARNAGAEVAKGKYLVFLDADTQATASVLTQALEAMAQERQIGGGVLLSFGAANPSGVKLWNWISMKFDLAAGGFFFVTAEAFAQTGGFSQKVYASEEIWLSNQLKRLGRRAGRPFRILDCEPILTSDRKLSWFGPIRYGLMFLMVCIFPWMLRFRFFLPIWYKRPLK